MDGLDFSGSVCPSFRPVKLIKIEYIPSKPWFKKKLWLLCPACNKVVIRTGHGSAQSKTCGCQPWKKHGYSSPRHPLYIVWKSMKARCLSKTNNAWPNYGGKGIKICKEWMDFMPFFNWANKSGWKPGLMLDRKDNNGNYTPKNCRFTTVLESNRNRSFCITKEQALAVHALLHLKTPERQIAKLTKVELWTVRNIKRGLCWRKDQCLT